MTPADLKAEYAAQQRRYIEVRALGLEQYLKGHQALFGESLLEPGKCLISTPADATCMNCARYQQCRRVVGFGWLCEGCKEAIKRYRGEVRRFGKAAAAAAEEKP